MPHRHNVYLCHVALTHTVIETGVLKQLKCSKRIANDLDIDDYLGQVSLKFN